VKLVRACIATAYEDEAAFAAEWMRTAAKEDRHHVHSLITNAEDADLIIFCETHLAFDPFYERVYWHPLARRFPDKTFLYQDGDYPCPLMPGVYPSALASQRDWSEFAGGVYLARLVENDAIGPMADAPRPECRYLFSFWGSNNNSARRDILLLKAESASLLDTSGTHYWLLSSDAKAAFENDYVCALLASKFALCPRGIGPSSYRLFEAMQLGITPVIISDEWVPPAFIPWDQFSLRVAERHIYDIPRILAENFNVYDGDAARQAWKSYVARPNAFHYLVETCLEIKSGRRHPRRADAARDYLRLLPTGWIGKYIRWRVRHAKSFAQSCLMHG
jgi:hypothetical protein